jgi:hypothetical protein
MWDVKARTGPTHENGKIKHVTTCTFLF